MNDLNVVVKQQAAVVSANFEEIKTAITAQMDQYKGLVYNDDNIKDARNDVAALRKVAKALDAKRKEVKKTYMIPYDEFEKKTKEIISIINDTIDPIDQQIKLYEEEKRNKRKIAIENYFEEKADGNQYVCLEEVFDSKWLSNMSTSMKSIKAAIDTYIDNVNKDIETIESFDSEVTEKAIAKYLNTKQLSDAINIIQEHERIKAEIIKQEEEKRKKEEERKRHEEIERVRREEAERVRKEEAERKRIAEEAASKAREEERKRIEAEREAELQKTTFIRAEDVEQSLKPQIDFAKDLEKEPLPPVEDDIPFNDLEPLEELEPLGKLPGIEELAQIAQRKDGKEETIERITKLLVTRLGYAYCDNCGTEMDDCDDCHRKYQNWSLSEGTARNIAEEIVNTIL